MTVSKVVWEAKVLIDLTGDTVTPETLAEGVIAHDASGKRIVGTAKIKPAFTNLVPSSIDTDGSIFDGVGYRDGYRLSSSGTLSAQANTVTTGFISCKSTDIIRMAGTLWSGPTTTTYNYIAFYDAAFSLLGSFNIYHYNGTTTARGIIDPDESKSSITTDENGVTVFDLAFTDGSNVAYMRLNGSGVGADMIVTINEEIY